MIFKNRYEKYIKTFDELCKMTNNKLEARNDIIDSINIKICGHFGNAVQLLIDTKNYHFSNLNSTENIGYVIRFLIDLFDLSADNGVNINTLYFTPLRMVVDITTNAPVAIGHFMKDEFIQVSDIIKIKE